MVEKTLIKKLLFTQPAADRFIHFFIRAGFSANHLPVIKTNFKKPQPQKISKLLQEVNAVAVISPTAARWLCSLYPNAPDNYAANNVWMAPGISTANILKSWRLSPIYPIQEQNAIEMLELFAKYSGGKDNLSTQSILWLGGKFKNVEAKKWLDQRGINCIHYCCYSVTTHSYSGQVVSRFADHLWIVSSSRTLQQADKIFREHDIKPQLLVTSSRLQKVAIAMGYTPFVSLSVQPQHILNAIT